MTECIGIELDGQALRAVRLGGRAGPRVLETSCDPASPAEAVRAIREGLGRARRVALAVRLPLLFAKRVRLPAMPAAERRNVLRLEPQRYFPVRLEDLVVAVREDDLVFAAREASVGEWIRALEELGPVDLVEPGPVALARSLAEAGIRDAVVALDDREAGLGVIELRAGSVAGVRRLYGGGAQGPGAPGNGGGGGGGGGATTPRIYLSPWTQDRATELAADFPGTVLEPLPDLRAIPSSFLSAYGAALGIGGDLEQALLPDDQRRRILGRRRKKLVVAMLAAAASAVFLVASLDAWRARTANSLAAAVNALEVQTAPAIALQRQLTALDRETRAVAGIVASRPDPLRVLLLVSERMPRTARLRSLRLSGAEWQIDGYARRAAEVTQALGGTPALSDVRVLAATNRAQMGKQMNESFALAFRLVPRP